VKSGGAEPAEDKGSWMSKAFRTLNPWSKSDKTNASGN
jgi:hypothetical protein